MRMKGTNKKGKQDFMKMETDDREKKGRGKKCTARKGGGKEKRRVGFIFTCQQHSRP